jgi:muramoyltetrapeptide carboxypeptidase LdcA involved in peptidoglycan recycling
MLRRRESVVRSLPNCMLKPKRLQPGDTVMAVSPSWGGPGAYPRRYRLGKETLERDFGLRVVESEHALRDPDWLQRHPEARAADLTQAFSDNSVKAVIATIGGDDSIRILRHLDPGLIAAHPKIFLGYSDTTVAHFACFRAGLVSFYGPSVMAGFADNFGMHPYTAASVRRTLFSTDPVGVIEPYGDGWTAEFLDWGIVENESRRRRLESPRPWRFLQGHGTVEGPLIGGCLDVVEFLRGTDWWPALEAFDGAILFLETSEEGPPPATVARALRSYAAMNILPRLGGILFGRPGGGEPVADFDRYDEAIVKVVRDEEGLTELPIVTQMDFGHTDPMFILPYGIRARIDCEGQRFEIVEAAVS